MHCPTCGDEYEPGVLTCADCGVPLVDAPVGTGATGAMARAAPDQVVLGRFHPAIAAEVVRLLDRRGVEHTAATDGDEVEIVVDPGWREDLRAELTLTWGEMVRGLPEEVGGEVLAAGGAAPGWYDAPQGGHIDRAGRLVMDDGDDDVADEGRLVGPALLTAGAILAVTGWLVFDAAAVTLAGVALAIVGLILPR